MIVFLIVFVWIIANMPTNLFHLLLTDWTFHSSIIARFSNLAGEEGLELLVVLISKKGATSNSTGMLEYFIVLTGNIGAAFFTW